MIPPLTTYHIDPVAADRIAVIRRTINWIEDNPDKALRGWLAATDDGGDCYPDNPEATCFCFLGRLSVEAGLKVNQYTDVDPIREWLLPIPATTGCFVSINDKELSVTQRVQDLRDFIDTLEAYLVERPI